MWKGGIGDYSTIETLLIQVLNKQNLIYLKIIEIIIKPHQLEA